MIVDIASITVDERLQPRAAINDEAVDEYADLIASGVRFDPVMCFSEGDTLWLVEGFHRVKAHIQAGKTSIHVETKNGSFRDAWLHSLGTNDKHGVRRTNADKRKVVFDALQDEEIRTTWTVRQIAAHCSVSHGMVDKIKHEILSIMDKREVKSQESPKKEAEAKPTESPSAKPEIPEPDPLPQPVMVDIADEENAAEAEREVTASIEALYRIAEADDKLAEALAALNLQAQQVSHYEKENARLMNENAELRKQCDYWRRKAIKAVPAAA